jgi:hypothetical protein
LNRGWLKTATGRSLSADGYRNRAFEAYNVGRERALHLTTFMRQRHQLFWAFAVAGILLCLDVRAQDLMLEDAPPSSRAVSVAPVVVTPDVRPHSTTVLQGEELWRRGFRTLGDALEFVTGISTERTTLGTVYSQRGIPNGFSLVLDGVPQVAEGERAMLDVDDLSLGDVDRVEVVRGPVTAVNGVGSLSGVIRVFTRKPGLSGAGARIGVTHHGEREVYLDGTWRLGGTWGFGPQRFTGRELQPNGDWKAFPPATSRWRVPTSGAPR